jgi:1-acyl-sn-glycerol-3-phosphate acyltransferase
MKTKIQKCLVVITQLFILATVRLIYFTRVKVRPNIKSELTNPVVIASNHFNEMDPFIIACFLPIKTILKVFPYAFMTANVYYYRWWKPLAFLAGCYPAKARTPDDKEENFGVGRSLKLLRKGYSVVMFPEGKRTRGRLDAKPGISKIMSGFEGKLLLCRVSWDSRR